MIRIITVASQQPTWVQAGFDDYAKRLLKPYTLELVEVMPAKRYQGSTQPTALQEEGKKMLARVSAGAFIVALDVKGQYWNTETFSQKLESWQQQYRTICLLIGGADGLAPMCLEAANICWSLSPLVFPHGLVRIIVAEQIYRAWSLLHNHPYHRGSSHKKI